MILPKDLANATSLRGETILGLICLHNEDQGEDPSIGNEEGSTPLLKQVAALKQFLKISEEQTKIAESLLSGGLPTFETFCSECRRCGLKECFIFRAISLASTDVALHILNALSSVVKRSLPGHGYRGFFEENGEAMLLTCIERRSMQSLMIILHGILGIDAVWQRRITRKFQKTDKIQVEIPSGSGKWLNGVVIRKIHKLYEIELEPLDLSPAEQIFSCEDTERCKTYLNDISTSQIRWRSQVVECLRVKCALLREQLDSLRSQNSKEYSSTASAQKQISMAEGVYSEALSVVTQRMLPFRKG